MSSQASSSTSRPKRMTHPASLVPVASHDRRLVSSLRGPVETSFARKCPLLSLRQLKLTIRLPATESRRDHRCYHPRLYTSFIAWPLKMAQGGWIGSRLVEGAQSRLRRDGRSTRDPRVCPGTGRPEQCSDAYLGCRLGIPRKAKERSTPELYR
jgi:hypothetical protein